MHPSADLDENGDRFEVWLVKRSFALLAPVCQLGLALDLLFLCVFDPLYYVLDPWPKVVPHAWLIAWDMAAAVFLAGVLVLGTRAHSHRVRSRMLLAFFAGTALLLVCFGVLSWLNTGDLSLVAMAQILVAAVLCVPGSFRLWTYGLQALAIGLLLAWLDPSGRFLGHLHFANLLLIAAVAIAIDRYMLHNAEALFAQKCRVAAERRRADAVLYNALPPGIAEELKLHQRVKAQSHPDMAILFADIVGFTAFAAERAPDQVLAVLNELFSEMDALVELHAVEKIKTMGDAYMVVSPTQPEALACLALALGDLMQRFNASRNLGFALRVGLHCGPTIAGVIGKKRFLYDVWGDAVNLASRMESSGEPGRIHASESLFQVLRHAFEFEARGLTDIKGKGLLPTYFLLGSRAADSGQQAA